MMLFTISSHYMSTPIAALMILRPLRVAASKGDHYEDKLLLQEQFSPSLTPGIRY